MKIPLATSSLSAAEKNARITERMIGLTAPRSMELDMQMLLSANSPNDTGIDTAPSSTGTNACFFPIG